MSRADRNIAHAYRPRCTPTGSARRQSSTDARICWSWLRSLFLLERGERPYLLFTQWIPQKQLGGRHEHGFGWECMLGKLCRLEKPGGLTSDETLSATQIEPHRRSICDPGKVYPTNPRMLCRLRIINKVRRPIVAESRHPRFKLRLFIGQCLPFNGPIY